MVATLPQRRAKLFPRHPVAEPLVHDLGVEGAALDDLRAFAISTCRERNSWSVQHARTSPTRRISRSEAERELRRALAALAAEGGEA